MTAKLNRNIDLEIALKENEKLKAMLSALQEEARKSWEEKESLRFDYSLLKLKYNKLTTKK